MNPERPRLKSKPSICLFHGILYLLPHWISYILHYSHHIRQRPDSREKLPWAGNLFFWNLPVLQMKENTLHPTFASVSHVWTHLQHISSQCIRALNTHWLHRLHGHLLPSSGCLGYIPCDQKGGETRVFFTWMVTAWFFRFWIAMI